MNLDTFIERVRVETRHLSQSSDPNSDAFRQQLAKTLMAVVPIYLSSGMYSALLASGTAPAGIANTLAAGAGICGHHVELAASTLEALGVPWRDVQIFYRVDDEPRNHTIVEVEWGSHWRMVDVTWGFIPHHGDLATALSWQDASATGHRNGLHNSALPWRLAVEDQDDIFGYLDPGADLVLFGGSGDFRIPIDIGEFATLHNGVARSGSWNHLLGRTSQGDIYLELGDGSFRVEMKASVSHSGQVVIGDTTSKLDAGPHLITIEIAGPGLAPIKFIPEGEIGHVTVESLAVQSRDGKESTALSIETHPIER